MYTLRTSGGADKAHSIPPTRRGDLRRHSHALYSFTAWQPICPSLKAYFALWSSVLVFSEEGRADVCPCLQAAQPAPNPLSFHRWASHLLGSHTSLYPPCSFCHSCKLWTFSVLKPNEKYSPFHPDGWQHGNWDQCSLKVRFLNRDDVTLMSSPGGDLFEYRGK